MHLPHQLVKDLVSLWVGVLEGVNDALPDVPQRRRHLLHSQDWHLGGSGVCPELPLLVPLQQLAEAHEIRLQGKQPLTKLQFSPHWKTYFQHRDVSPVD